MLKSGIYVDAENIRLSGGYGMRYDVLVALAQGGGYSLLRANCYLAEDRERTRRDPEYRLKVHSYHDILRQCGFKVIKKPVRRFYEEDGTVTTKANADMDLAIDALLQARNLDRIVLLTGDGDFIRLVIALQNMGCRVEVIAFDNVNHELREAADSFTSGYLIPGLLPIQGIQSGGNWQRGMVVNYNPDRGFGFLRYLHLEEGVLRNDTIFFHRSKSNLAPDHGFGDFVKMYEFRIIEGIDSNGRPEAVEVRLYKGDG